MDQFMPALPLKGAKIVIVGGGEAAENKLRLFRAAPCAVVWHTLGGEGRLPAGMQSDVTLNASPRVPPAAFDGAALVFIAVEETRLAARLARRAKRAGALVNVVDRTDLCDFYTPAVIDRGAVTVAFSTGGAAPVLARDLRSAVEGVVPPGAGILAEAANDLRDSVKKVIDDFEKRREFWVSALRGPAAIAADKGDAPGTRRALLQSLDTFRGAAPEKTGVVHLVGAGPGDPELLTVKAARLIRDADVIVHDRLVSPEVIDRARRDAHRIDVGKSRGTHPVPQERINEILIEQARQGRNVVRLKGGDAFIFGRGGEELEALREAGIEAHVTPGISAALACAASAQTPLTHRDSAQAVSFVTGQPKKGGQAVDYTALSAANHTVVVYMGVGTAAETAAAMIEAGRDPATPVALIENGTRADERILTGTLSGLGELVTREAVKGPAVIIVGEVARHARTSSGELRALAAQAERSAA
ncbi:MAG: uroporphyrinogen-III C-methyltransferase [Euryhalocaulis sp.]|uniref:siroheme synthase CysG n=1 Tax=Euryhalocaulis sp. TaxID=2744307 RepID=UPI0017FB0ED5|nr:siroheme synthase CysG [Euryhalocaulis sp.]MBA4803001.1 uroporphyrinogen-III C-methyltransferase [Euryhalocaulis sp.]